MSSRTNSDSPDVGRVEAARAAKDVWSARLAALEDGTLQWIERNSKASFSAESLADAFGISPQAANNRLLRLTKVGVIERYRQPGPGKRFLYRRKIELWEGLPIDLAWHYLQVLRLRAIIGARKPETSQQVCRVIADELTRVSGGDDPAGFLRAIVREQEEAMRMTQPPDWTDKQFEEVKSAFE